MFLDSASNGLLSLFAMKAHLIYQGLWHIIGTFIIGNVVSVIVLKCVVITIHHITDLSFASIIRLA